MALLVDQWNRPIDVDAILEQREQARVDAWANEQTGLGVAGLDKSRSARYLSVWRVLDQELTSMYSGDDLCKKIVGKRPEEMFRRGFEVESDDVEGSDRDELRDYATDTLNLETNLLEAMRWGRLYGGALACMDIDDGRYPWEPLDEAHIRSFNSIAVVDRRYAYVQSQYANIGGSQSKYGQAQIYLISNAVAGYGWNSYGIEKIEKLPARELAERGAMVSLWHESRVIRFDGHSADIVTRQQLAGWSWSVLQVVFDALRQFAGSFDSAGYLLHDASQAVFKLQGLIKAITSGQRGAIAARTQLMEMTRSVLRGILLDAGGPDGKNAEDFKREPTSFAGIPELLDRMMLRLSAAADMPATELFGRAPAGLNATGENDTRKWYDTIATEQSNVLGPRLKRIFKLLALAKDGPIASKKPVKWTVKFHPLWSPTDSELATTRKTNADRDVAYINAGVVTPEEVAVDLTDVYPNLDVEKREEAIKSGLLFNPYENEPAPTDSALIAGKTGSGQEPLSPQTPVALYGTSGTQVSAGNYPPVAAATSASHGMQPPLQSATKKPQNPSSRPPVGKVTLRARQAANEEAQRRKAQSMAPIVKGATIMAGIGKKTPSQQDEKTRGDAAVSADPAGNTYEGEAAICLVWDPAGRLLTVTRPEPPHEMAIPGGHIDPSETPLHAAVRELREETRILVRSLDHIATIRSPLDGRRVYVFRATKWRGVPRANEPNTEIAWLTPEELLIQSETFANSVRELRDAGLLRRPLAPGGGIARQLNPPVHEDAAEAEAWREDAEMLARLPELTASRADGNAARAVYEQLLGDYHAKDLGWVLPLDWSEPQSVPLERINFSDRARWRATHDGTLKGYVEKIQEGRLKPSIYVEPPNSLLDVVDGHHRTLANESLGRSPLAYVAKVPSAEGPWAHLHSLQKKGSSKTGAPAAASRDSSREASRGPARDEPDDLAEQYADDALDADELPDDFGTEVPPRKGSKCADCRFLELRDGLPHCLNETFMAWASQRRRLPIVDGAVRIPAPGNDPRAYCCSAWQAAPGAFQAIDRADQQAFGFARSSEKLLNPRGLKGHWTEQDATVASRHAGDMSDAAKDGASHLEAAKAHGIAARAHRMLSEPHGRKGNKKASAAHVAKAQEHDRRAGEHILEATTPAAARGDAFNPDQPRNPDGTFGEGGGSSKSPKASSSHELFAANEFASLPTKSAQTEKDPDKLFAQAKEAHEQQLDLLDRGSGLAKDLGAEVVRGDQGNKPDLSKTGPQILIGPMKRMERSGEKVQNDYGGDWSQLRDIVRSSVAVDKMSDVHKVVDALKARGVTLAQQPKDRFAHPTAEGYRDLLLNVRYPNGHVGELQVHVKPMLEAKAKAHGWYEQTRSLDPKLTSRSMGREDWKLFDQASRKQKAAYRDAWTKATGGKADAGDWDESKHTRGPDGKFGEGTATDKPQGEHGFASSTPKAFHEAFEKAFEGSPYANHVSHYSEAELAGMKSYLSADGKTGVAVHDHGDGRVEATALFNRGGEKGAGRAMLEHVVEHAGVNYVECMGDELRTKYESLGFKVDSKSPFDASLAAPTWDRARFGEPPYYTMRLGGGGPKGKARGDAGGDWDEERHPRDEHGRFGSGGGAPPGGGPTHGRDQPFGNTRTHAPEAKTEKATEGKGGKLGMDHVNMVYVEPGAGSKFETIAAYAEHPQLAAWLAKQPVNERPNVEVLSTNDLDRQGGSGDGHGDALGLYWQPRYDSVDDKWSSPRIELAGGKGIPIVPPKEELAKDWGTVWTVASRGETVKNERGFASGEFTKTPAAYAHDIFLHELGHHVEMGPAAQRYGGDGEHPKIREIVDRAYESMWNHEVAKQQEGGSTAGMETLKALTLMGERKSPAISRYAVTNPREYFAESFTAYQTHPDELKAHDAYGYNMVKTVLKRLEVE